MKTVNFLRAIEIIGAHHSTTIVINHIEPNAQVKIDNSISIIECCAAVVSELEAEGFSLSMHNNMLSVNKYL